MAFEYKIGQRVALAESDETGVIVGRAEYRSNQNTYLVLYQAGDGRQVEAWWGEDSITTINY